MSYRGGERVILTVRGVVEESDDVGIIGLWRVPLDFSWPPYSESMALYQKNAPMGRIDPLGLLAHSARDTKSRSQVMIWNARHSPGRVRVGRTQYAFAGTGGWFVGVGREYHPSTVECVVWSG